MRKLLLACIAAIAAVVTMSGAYEEEDFERYRLDSAASRRRQSDSSGKGWKARVLEPVDGKDVDTIEI